MQNCPFYRAGQSLTHQLDPEKSVTAEQFIIRPRLNEDLAGPNPYILEWTDRHGQATRYPFFISKTIGIKNVPREFFIITWLGGLVLRAPSIEDLLDMLCVQRKPERVVESQYTIRKELKNYSSLQLKQQSCSYVLIPFVAATTEPRKMRTEIETGLMLLHFPTATASPLVPTTMGQAIFKYTLNDQRLLLEPSSLYQCKISLQFHHFIDFIEAFALFGASRATSQANSCHMTRAPSPYDDLWRGTMTVTNAPAENSSASAAQAGGPPAAVVAAVPVAPGPLAAMVLAGPLPPPSPTGSVVSSSIFGASVLDRSGSGSPVVLLDGSNWTAH